MVVVGSWRKKELSAILLTFFPDVTSSLSGDVCLFVCFTEEAWPLLAAEIECIAGNARSPCQRVGHPL